MNITNDKVTDFINNYYVPFDEDLGRLRAYCEDLEIPLILKETEDYLRTILTIIKPKRILEIGTAFGYSSLFFARFIPGCKVTTLERSPYMYSHAKMNLEKYDENNQVELLVGDAIENLEKLIEESESEDFEPYDLVFIDAAKSHYREFLELSEKLCRKGSVIICDNVLMKAYLVDKDFDPGRRHRTSVKRMTEFIDYIYERKDLTVSLLSSGDGLAIIVLDE